MSTFSSSEPPQVFILGTKERREKCAVKIMQHVHEGSETKETLLMTPFTSMEEWNTYNEKLTKIKSVIADSMDLLENGMITMVGLSSRIANDWYPLTVQFIAIYGREMVPFDVRWAINDVEKNCFLAMPSTWPRRVLYEE